MKTNPRFGGNAFAILTEVRRCNRVGTQFSLSPEAVNRVLPEIGRHAFQNARDVLVEAGLIEKVRSFRRDHNGKHDAALYVLAPVRERESSRGEGQNLTGEPQEATGGDGRKTGIRHSPKRNAACGLARGRNVRPSGGE